MEQGLSWQVQTHEHREHSPDWYWALGILTLVGIGLSLYFSNILFAIILLIGATSIGILVARGPREHAVSVDHRGIAMDGTLYPYTSIHSFWVEPEVENPRLFLTTSSFLHQHIIVPLDSREHGQQVRELLLQFSTEEERLPRLSEEIAEIFGL